MGNDYASDGTGMVHLVGSSFTSIRALLMRATSGRARLWRALVSLTLIGGALALAGCYAEDGYQLPTRAMKELSPEMLGTLEQKNMPKDSPILVRIFKEESELEVWKQDTSGRFELLKTYPICRWSGELGPKVKEGDRQAPEGFYTITPGLMNPNSNYYLAINMGFPNAYDKANNYSGAFLMIHGDCSSRGCYAMTDEQIGEIYSLARESFLGGQKSFQIQAYPFRMTAPNLARHRTNPNMAFWKMLKQGNDHFEVTHLEPKVDVCERHYVFDAQPPADATKPLAFSPTGHCPVYEVAPEIAGPANDKQRNDEFQLAQLTSRNSPTAPIVMGTDGGMNRVFASKLEMVDAAYDNEGHLRAPPVHPGMPPPTLSAPKTTDTSIFGGLFASKSAAPQSATPQTQVASGSPPQQSTGFFGNLFKPKSDTTQPVAAPPKGTTLAGLTPQPGTAAEPRKSEAAKSEPQKPETQTAEAPKPKAKTQEAKAQEPKPQPDASAVPPAPATNNGSLIKGAQPVVPTGSFDGRWAGLQ
jgi:murein L,D-transpeptidase YafK